MTILRDLSVFISLIIKMLVVMMLFENRFPKKKGALLFAGLFAPLVLVNIFLFIHLTPQVHTSMIFFFLALPSIFILWLLAKHRDGRFIFTVCMVDTIFIEIGHLTNIIDHYIPGDTYIFMFVSRMVIFPLLAIWFYKVFRPTYMQLQNYQTKGWYTFAVIGILFYIMISLVISYPSMIFERPEYMPVLFLLFLLMPIVYFHIIQTMQRQKHFFEMKEQENILQLQAASMTARIKEFSEANEKLRIERHNFRHQMQVISSMVEKEEYEKLHLLTMEYAEATREAQIKRYCSHAVIDAVLSSYLQKAENRGISVSTKLAFPDTLPVNEAELATVFANAIENAIHACEKLNETQQMLEVKVLTQPQFMLQISNRFDGIVEFDKDGIPITHREGHGFGTRSIVAFCEKHDAFYEFKTTADTFSLRIMFR